MSDVTPGDKKPKPIFNPDDVVEPVETPADPTPADVAVEEPPVVKPARKPKADKAAEVAQPATVAPATTTATGEVAPVDAPTTGSEFAGREVVYVQAPVPPRLKGNRGAGSALAVLGALLFAVLFAGAVTLAFALNNGSTVGAAFTDFIQNAAFWVPVLVFLVAFVLLVLVVNRAGWAAHVFGSLLVALAVYFGSIGILLLLGVVIGAGAAEALGSFGALATNPIIIIAALVAREVSIWIGLAIAARGRRVKTRNLELVDEWEQEHAETKAQYERAGSTA
jgi:hypothetical protein